MSLYILCKIIKLQCRKQITCNVDIFKKFITFGDSSICIYDKKSTQKRYIINQRVTIKHG